MQTITKASKSKSKITQKRCRSRMSGDRMIHDGFNAFVDCNATELIDEWFHENELYSLNFKSKTWNRLKNVANKLTVQAMRQSIIAIDDEGEPVKINYSPTAGCSCGCSPGFKIRKLGRGGNHTVEFGSERLNNHNVWMTVSVDVKELKAKLPEFTKMLKEEIKSHN